MGLRSLPESARRRGTFARGLAALARPVLVIAALALTTEAHQRQGSTREQATVRTGVLLRALDKGAPGASTHAELVEALRRELVPAFEMLASGRLPLLEELEEGPLLSATQEEALLVALGQVGESEVLRTLKAWASAGEKGADGRVAQMLVLSAVGSGFDMPPLFDLARASLPNERNAEAFERALTRILRRERRALANAWREARESGPAVMEPVLRALGATRDPRVLDLLEQAIHLHPDLDQLAVAQVRLIAPPQDPTEGAGLAEWLRGELESSPQRCRAAALALGQMEDTACVERLLELLESTEGGVREAAHWSLQRIARVQLPLEAERWARWHAAETKWWETQRGRVLAELRAEEMDAFARALREVLAHPLHRHALADELLESLAGESGARSVRLCQALGQLGSPRASRQLLELFGDVEDELAFAAHGALQQITGKKLPMDREAWRRVLGDAH